MALVIVSIASMLYMTIYYSYMSRGYALVTLFFISSLYAVFNILRGGNEKRNWIAFAVSSILGFYTMPSFLYPFLTLNVFMFFSRPAGLKKQVLAGFMIVCVTVCLYLPVIIVNGIGALVNNQYVTPLPRMQVLKKLPSFFCSALTDITGISWSFVVTFLIISLLALILKKQKGALVFCLTFLAAPFACLLLHSVIPFSRTFVYYNVILTFIIVLPLRTWLEKPRPVFLFSILLLIQGALLWNFNAQIYEVENYSIVSHNVCKQIIGNKKYVCDDILFDAHLLYELKTNGFNRSEMKYINLVPLSADTVYGQDYIVIQTILDKTLQKQPLIKTPYYRIYN